ncbi:uncharacterized protein LOC131208210 [Anopheles bellator]|uniref:uncharacterized protein LOC131208210 n=1 Tax=Anopheles bellator TaxID=139047 RepID=UPI0026486BD9|nr:uncharacterized protein LOC131208210 [Anopheles bellator]
MCFRVVDGCLRQPEWWHSRVLRSMDSMNHVYCSSATATVAVTVTSPMTATTTTVFASSGVTMPTATVIEPASCASSTTTGGSPPLMLDEDALPELPPIDDDDDEGQEEDEEDQDMDEDEDDDDMPDDEDPEEDPSDGDDFSGDASLSALNEVKQMQSILLLHLDLIQEQGDQILTKDKVIIKLKDENELLRHQLEQANKRLTMALLQLQQLGQPVPHELQQQLQQHQQQQQQQQPKAEGTVSPLTIRSQMENGRLKAVVLKNSSTAGSSQSPPSSSSVSSTVLDTALQPAHSSSPLRNSEVSSTVSLIKEEPVEVLSPSMADGEPSMAAYYADVEIKAENNEVDGEIFLNYSKSDDDESASPPSSFGEERDDEDPESLTEGDALVPVVDQGCYASNDGDSPMQYTSDDLSNEVCLPGGEESAESVFIPMIKMECTDEPQLLGGYDHEVERNARDSSDIEQDEPLVESSAKVEEGPPADNKNSIRLVTMMAGDQNPTTTTTESERLTGHEQPKEESNEPNATSSNNNSNHSNSNSIHYNPHCGSSGGNSSDGSLVKQQGSRCGKSGIGTNAAGYMVTRKQYISCNWKDDAIASELERLLSNGAAELEIPSWSVIEQSESSVAGSPSSDDVPLAEEIRSRENITDEAYLKRHTKLEIDERRRKKWDVQRIREQKHIERLKKRQLKELPAEQDASKAINTFYPTVETLKYVVVTDDVPVQAFGELIPLLPAAGFSLPWHQVKSNGGAGGPGGGPSSCSSSASSLLSLSSCFANPSTSSLLPVLSSSDVHHRSEHRQHHPYLQPVPPPPAPPAGPSIPHSGGFRSVASFESKTKFLHRLAPSLQAQKQRFTKRMKKEV